MSCELDFAPVYVFYNKQVDLEWRWSYQIYLVVFRICLLSPFFSFKWSYLRVGLPISSTGVDLMLWAHEHSYERLFPIYDRQVRELTYWCDKNCLKIPRQLLLCCTRWLLLFFSFLWGRFAMDQLSSLIPTLVLQYI